ncbi:pilin [Phytohabitans houttuyneae]|uniref:Uncharacterized protein n=1 Tax=Phytohabitans houttuyneae TaxID=1076126 RepID=A0A6V8KW94_9ACTN|nr:pilin [Phytohabitans houttuyneae]GFJ84835.1 hypothetical protein Phou_090150 [Phytohabitans houttuyneae]
MTRKVFSRRCRRESTRGQPHRLPPCLGLLDRAVRLIPILLLAAVLPAVLLAWPGTAYAAEPADPPTEPTVTSLDQVIDNVRLWLLGILAAYATFCLVVAFFRYTSGEADEVAKAKIGFRSAAIGYAGAILAPLLVTIIGGWL